MEEKGRIEIRSKIPQKLSTSFEAGGETYLVMTEDAKPNIVTNVYLGGKVVKTEKTDYSAILKAQDLSDKVRILMKKQHNRTVNAFKEQIDEEAEYKERRERRKAMPPEKRKEEVKTPSDYLDDTKNLLARKNYKGAIAVLAESLGEYPEEPFLLSYFGCLDAIVNKNYKKGIDNCKKSLKALDKKLPFGQEFYLPVLYLNLGRAYLAADRKEEAVDALNMGLKMDPDNRDLLWEMKKLGTRGAPPISFLDRSNPINKYIGMVLHKMRN
jgi:tetratricopeptide (TPR) repeat protein